MLYVYYFGSPHLLTAFQAPAVYQYRRHNTPTTIADQILQDASQSCQGRVHRDCMFKPQAPSQLLFREKLNSSAHVYLLGHGQQDLAALPNPRYTAHHPRRQDRHPSRSRNPRRSLPSPINSRLHHHHQRSKQQPRTTLQRAQRRHHRRPLQLHLQERGAAAAEPDPPRRALVLPAQDRRPRLRRRGFCRRGGVAGEPCPCWCWRDCRQYGHSKGLCRCAGWRGCTAWYGCA